MNLTTENILLIGSILLFISILAGKTSYRFGVPAILFFLAVGILAGSEGIGGIYFDDPQTTQFIGIMSLNFILFSGGLGTDWKTIKPVFWQGLSLSSLGVLITAILVGVFVYLITDLSLYEGMLLGAIVSSTDAAAVFSILRSKNLALKHNLRPTLELESGSNDPMAYFLTVIFISLLTMPEVTIVSIVALFFRQMIIGALIGVAFGRVGTFIINNIKLDYEGLYPVLAIAIMYFTFSLTDFIGGNGFLAVYLTAVYIGNQEFIHKRAIFKSFDGFAWLMQIVLFLTLGLLVFPSDLVSIIGIGLVISLFLILLARPISVLLSLMFSKTSLNCRLFISCVGLRGAVPIVFATYPLLARIESSQLIFNIVFFVSVSSVLIQGTTLSKIAKWLGVTLPEDAKPKSPVEELLEEGVKSEYLEITIKPNSKPVGKRIVELNFPKKAIIAMIRRKDHFITPKGSTEIEAGDVLMILSEDKDTAKNVRECLN